MTPAAQTQAVAVSERRKDQCFLCKWIAEDLALNGRLTGYPIDLNGQGIFPVYGKERHLALESGSIDNLIV